MAEDEVALPDTAPRVHEHVATLLEGEARGRILDMGAWEGSLSLLLKRLGFDVYACDVACRFKVKGVPFVLWDFNSKEEPYEEDYFDYVACVEVIEHLEDPYHLIRQIERILRPSGKLILSTPNILSINSRISFLASGYFSFFGENEHEHINPLPFWELRRILKANGFVIESVTTNKLTKTFKMLRPLTSLISLSEVILGGQILVVKARLDRSTRRKPDPKT